MSVALDCRICQSCKCVEVERSNHGHTCLCLLFVSHRSATTIPSQSMLLRRASSCLRTSRNPLSFTSKSSRLISSTTSTGSTSDLRLKGPKGEEKWQLTWRVVPLNRKRRQLTTITTTRRPSAAIGSCAARFCRTAEAVAARATHRRQGAKMATRHQCTQHHRYSEQVTWEV